MFAVVGYGFVGKGTEYLLTICGHQNVSLHDPAQGFTVSNWKNIEYAFLCVPTPEGNNGELDLTILVDVYNMMLENDVIPVIRSTIGPDQVKLFPQAIMMPEFLREAKWVTDVEEMDTVVLGGGLEVQPLIRAFAGKKVIHTDPVTAMMYKLSRNAVLATKVILANQINSVCDKLGADYTQLVEMFKINNTLGESHWDVPGPDGQYGFGGKCFPKDISHMASLCEDKQNNIFSYTKQLNSQIRNQDSDDV